MKNDDMDDMIKRAAENYELNEELASDWNKVYAGINQPEESFTAPKQKKRKWLLIFWLLLIPGLLLTAYETNLFTSSKSNDKVSKTSVHKNLSIPYKQSQNQPVEINKNSQKAHIIALNEKSISDKKNIPAVKASLLNNSKLLEDSTTLNSSLAINNVQANVTLLNNKINLSNTPEQQLPATANEIISKQQNQPTQNKNQLIQNKIDLLIKPATNDSAFINNDSALSQQSKVLLTQSTKQHLKTNNYTKQSFAYVGVLAGVDVSFVKNQKTSSPALGAGLITGYHLKNRITIETGLLYDKKNYYTAGKYFNKSKLEYLQSIDLIKATGNCNMFEIPLNIKYDFASHKKYNWFVTAGTSSYLMHKEYYNFQYAYNGMTGQKDYTYKNSSSNWFSVLNMGAGINIHTSNKYFIQVQPYYKTSLSGVGIGSLSLNSAGINFSISRRIP